jgi:putative ABC transport system permease protein
VNLVPTDGTKGLTGRLPIPPARFADPVALNAYLDRIADSVQAIPGVQVVALAEGLPTQGAPFGRAFQVTDQPPIPAALRPGEPLKTVSASYFQAVRLQVREGRSLSERDRHGSPRVIVVNETFARLYFPGMDAVGKRLLMEPYGTDDVWEVVGVVADEGLSWQGEPEAMVYATREQNPSDYLALVVRGTVGPDRLREPVRRAVSAVDRDQALTDIQPLDNLKTDFMASDRLRSALVGIFAVVAVALATLGLYGVLAYIVTQRRREMGIRAALGASPTSVVAQVVRQGMMMTGWGLALGVGGALAVGRLLATFDSRIASSSLGTIIAVVGILTGVALVARYVPARRAANVDALVALRSD